MKGLCKTDCGMEIEYVPHEFSDGFVYYLPRNLDGKVHNCIFSEDPDFFNLDVDEDDEVLKEFCQKHKDRLKLSPAELVAIMASDPWGSIELPMDLDFMNLVRRGNVYSLKKYVEKELNITPMPYLAHRSDFRYHLQDEQEIFETKATQEQIIGYTWIELPTSQGYQLEYLGKIYELMIRLEDAKKCFELQYECTREPELKKHVEELDKKIQERRNTEKVTEDIPDNLTSEDMRTKIELTELNIRKYVVELFSNNFTELFKKNPTLKEQCQKRRKKDEDTMLNFNENSPIDTVSLGSLAHILKISRGIKRSKFRDTCKICKRSWEKNEDIFSENIPKKISCVDKTCFAKQGGFVKNTPIDFVHRIENISKTRNILSHPRDYDQEMFKIILRETYETCNIINYWMEEFFKNKQSI